ncbi:MAG: hypothetical protein NTY22_07395, partial [Proteobacteria bacterium]|nr:hypothetical protein [Pseudomonadota bacterium]
KIYKDIEDCHPDFKVYLATHSKIGNYYEKAEENSGLEFWGMSIYANENPSGSALKNPDGIVADSKRNVVLYVLEIKWGWIPESGGTPKSDFLDLVNNKKGFDERRKIQDAISNGKSCRIGKRKFPKEDPYHKKDFKIIKETTRFLLISDFYQLIQYDPQYNIMDNLKCLIPELICLDYQQTHKSDFGVIESFGDYVSSTDKGNSDK